MLSLCNVNFFVVVVVLVFIFGAFFNCILGLEVHVKNMQDCCIGIHMAVICCLSPHHLYLAFLPRLSLPSSPPGTVPPLFPPIDPSVWYSLPCVHVFSFFITHLWVRICGISFSILVSLCWEWCSPDSSTSLQTTWTLHFWLLHNIPWCICATFFQSSLL